MSKAEDIAAAETALEEAGAALKANPTSTEALTAFKQAAIRLEAAASEPDKPTPAARASEPDEPASITTFASNDRHSGQPPSNVVTSKVVLNKDAPYGTVAPIEGVKRYFQNDQYFDYAGNLVVEEE